MNAELLVVGRIARAHGNQGHVIVNPETDFPEERFRVGNTLLVGEDEAQPRRIARVRFHQGRPIVALEGIETMDDAEALAGATLRMPMTAMQDLPAGTFYHHDLVGCEVFDTAGSPLGHVAAVEGSLERSRLVVQRPRGELLIPFVADICVEIEPERQRIVVNPPEGLLELNERANTESC